MAAAACRRVLRSADRWRRGPPPPLRLPSGSQRRYTIGRELACDMTLGDQSVSRWHASLVRGPDGWLLDDLGSTNGTRLNGWRVTSPSQVRDGDLVSFGRVTFVLADRPQ
jgi:pSer/pThr/pTyr-binding forkhead associated (FHA) protein